MNCSNSSAVIFVLTVVACIYCAPHGGPGPQSDGPGGPGGPGGPMGMIMRGLSFLRNVTPEARQQFMEISMNFNLTKGERESQLLSWAQAQSAEVQAAFTNFTQTIQQKLEDVSQKFSANLSGDALSLFNSIKAVMQNNDLTPVEQCYQISNLTVVASPEAKQALHIPLQMPPGFDPCDFRWMQRAGPPGSRGFSMPTMHDPTGNAAMMQDSPVGDLGSPEHVELDQAERVEVEAESQETKTGE
ncbi:hypothetical protein DdX_16669 [Ditylenchus destructor]|uniref:SXP/RAL-2 family protein Ani s 5-like cation-binding domain-containing protein n=1 Tax=Ditylenchus destructor TaxID=166010 RepID=A0AAD4MPY9_9BILA|nr:hypothetical protein DdX_16669 [Ditylenchus destructor]